MSWDRLHRINACNSTCTHTLLELLALCTIPSCINPTTTLLTSVLVLCVCMLQISNWKRPFIDFCIEHLYECSMQFRTQYGILYTQIYICLIFDNPVVASSTSSANTISVQSFFNLAQTGRTSTTKPKHSIHMWCGLVVCMCLCGGFCLCFSTPI